MLIFKEQKWLRLNLYTTQYKITELVDMFTKALGKTEVERGYVRIPAKSRAELMGELTPPFDTVVNDLPASTAVDF
jgi:hypothetical protein